MAAFHTPRRDSGLLEPMALSPGVVLEHGVSELRGCGEEECDLLFDEAWLADEPTAAATVSANEARARAAHPCS